MTDSMFCFVSFFFFFWGGGGVEKKSCGLLDVIRLLEFKLCLILLRCLSHGVHRSF